MDRGPFRTPQSSDRRPASRPEQAYRPADEPQARSESRPVARTAEPYYEATGKKSGRRFLLPLAICFIVILLAVGGWFLWTKLQDNEIRIDADKYQVVVLSNNQFYFGKLEKLNDQYMKLKNVYYMENQDTAEVAQKDAATANTTGQEGANSGYRLAKLSALIYQPENEMIIPKAQIVHFENLKSDSKAAQLMSSDTR
ncbi:MAG: hypothetical protein WBP12_00830 [Candidatus Saccharimonas sp.]